MFSGLSYFIVFFYLISEIQMQGVTDLTIWQMALVAETVVGKELILSYM